MVELHVIDNRVTSPKEHPREAEAVDFAKN
jgi:hypothetical protein